MVDFQKKKILIIHDRFQFRGGGERLVLKMARLLNADIATEFWANGDTYEKAEALGKIFVLDRGEPKQIVWRYFRAHFNFYFKTKKFINDYDLVIFSGNNCLTAAFNLKSNKPNFYYCHSPVRYVYDLLRLRCASEPSFFKKIVYYDWGKWLIRFVYQSGLGKMKTILANSENVKKRLKDFCRVESQVVYPPVGADFSWRGQGDYYLSFARLDELKRVGDIIRAFQKMPDKKLVVCSGGDEMQNILELSKGYSNIKIKGWVEDEELKDLVGNCIANIYIPVDEDFGMTPVEGMTAGKPCIVVDEGGLKETIIDEKTGKIIPADYKIEDIVEAVNYLTPDKAAGMKDACLERAKLFSTKEFNRKILAVVDDCIQ